MHAGKAPELTGQVGMNLPESADGFLHELANRPGCDPSTSFEDPFLETSAGVTDLEEGEDPTLDPDRGPVLDGLAAGGQDADRQSGALFYDAGSGSNNPLARPKQSSDGCRAVRFFRIGS